MEKLSELSFKICYLPGKENVPTDVLSRYGAKAVDVELAGSHDPASPATAAVLEDWLRVVAPKLTLQACIASATTALA